MATLVALASKGLYKRTLVLVVACFGFSWSMFSSAVMLPFVAVPCSFSFLR